MLLWIELDVDQCDDDVYVVEGQQVEVEIIFGEKIEEKEGYQVFYVYYLQYYCVVYDDNEIIGNLQVVGDEFWDCVEYIVDYICVNEQ